MVVNHLLVFVVVVVFFLSHFDILFTSIVNRLSNSYSTTATSFQDRSWQHTGTDWNTLLGSRGAATK